MLQLAFSMQVWLPMTEFLCWCKHEWIKKQWSSRILDIYIYILQSSRVDLHCSLLCTYARKNHIIMYIYYHVMWTSIAIETLLQSMQGSMVLKYLIGAICYVYFEIPCQHYMPHASVK